MQNKEPPYWEESKYLCFNLSESDLCFVEEAREKFDYDEGNFINPNFLKDNNWYPGVSLYEEGLFDTVRHAFMKLCNVKKIEKLFSLPSKYGEGQDTRSFYRDQFYPPLACSFEISDDAFDDFFNISKNQITLHPYYIFPLSLDFLFFSNHFGNFSMFASEENSVRSVLGMNFKSAWAPVIERRNVEYWRLPKLREIAGAYGLL